LKCIYVHVQCDYLTGWKLIANWTNVWMTVGFITSDNVCPFETSHVIDAKLLNQQLQCRKTFTLNSPGKNKQFHTAEDVEVSTSQ